MLSINCKNCDGRCCTSRVRKLFVVLTPQEENKFKDFSTKIKTPHKTLTILKNDNSGNCIFYDSKKNLCKSYKDRPFECRAYPLQIYFDNEVNFKLDSMVCPKIKECSLEEIEDLKKKWMEQHLPLDWIKAYSTFD